MAKKFHDPFENGLKAARPGYGVSYTEPFPKNGFVDHVIMKDYEDEKGTHEMNNPYNSLKDIDRLNGESRRELNRAAKGKKGPF
jgi:hypothetical protein